MFLFGYLMNFRKKLSFAPQENNYIKAIIMNSHNATTTCISAKQSNQYPYVFLSDVRKT